MPLKQLNSITCLCATYCLLLFSCTKTIPAPETPLPSTNDTIIASYPSVTICGKTWMTKNLDVITFSNGDTIERISGNDNWGLMYIQPKAAYCSFNDDTTYDAVYGKYYSWAAVTDPRGLAPAGWHIATLAEWTYLVDSCLGGRDIAGRELKEAGSAHWDFAGVPKYEGTNSSGLTCLGGGCREGTAFLNPTGFTGNWWCGTGDANGHPYMMRLYHISNDVVFAAAGNDGLPIRCVKD